MACCLLLLVVGGFAICGAAGSFGLMAVLMITSVAGGIIATSELTTADYVISTIGSSVRQNLPLPMALEMAAAGRNDKRAFILRNIKKWLVEGYSLSESLKRGYARCPGYAAALVAVGERIGQVPQALAALEQDLVAKVTLNKKVRHIPSFYPPIVLLIMFIVVLFIMTFIMPKFQEVLNEMGEGAQLPASTIILLRVVNFIRLDLGWVLGLLLIGGFMIGGAVYVRIKARPRRPDKPYLTSRIGDFIKWHLPFLRWYEWNRAMQRIAGVLRLSLNAGCTVNEAIANTLRLDFNGCFKKNLKTWLEKVERGDDIGQSARQCDMGSAMAWAFADLHNHSNTLDILDTLESAYRWGYNRAATLARFIIGPCETICLGLMVGFIVYAVFSSLVAIIHTTANMVVP
jgi:type II secretory pathway component PulF